MFQKSCHSWNDDFNIISHREDKTTTDKRTTYTFMIVGTKERDSLTKDNMGKQIFLRKCVRNEHP